MTKHFLTGAELTPKDLTDLLLLAETLREERSRGVFRNELGGKTIALVFEKPSLRTHVSFMVGVQELGGRVVDTFSLNRKKEEPEDVGRVLAAYTHGIVLRTHEHSLIERMTAKVGVPVINGLSDLHHPCQVLADLQTLKQCFGEIRGLKVAYTGDGNNILHSLLLMVPMLGGHVSYACPAGYQPNAFVVKRARAIAADCGGGVTACKTPQAAVKGADALYTDVWTSMGFEAEAGEREQAFRGFQLNAELYAKAAPDAIILHCLPMVRGKEITDEMAEHPRSRIFRQAENRLHAQKALLLKVLA